MKRIYKGHEIVKTNTTTHVYVSASIGYRKALRYLYEVNGDHNCGPIFTTIKEAKEWITERINKANKGA